MKKIIRYLIKSTTLQDQSISDQQKVINFHDSNMSF